MIAGLAATAMTSVESSATAAAGIATVGAEQQAPRQVQLWPDGELCFDPFE